MFRSAPVALLVSASYLFWVFTHVIAGPVGVVKQYKIFE